MKANVLVLLVVAMIGLTCLAGCGNVYLRGDAMTAAETSAMDAYQAVQRAEQEPASPAWETAYLAENFKQWRFFVRAAKKDEAWGPKLPDERGE